MPVISRKYTNFERCKNLHLSPRLGGIKWKKIGSGMTKKISFVLSLQTALPSMNFNWYIKQIGLLAGIVEWSFLGPDWD